MDRRAEVEFLSDDGVVSEPDEDVLHLGRSRRRRPPWVWLVALAAIGGLIAAALVSRPSSHKPVARPSSPTPPPTITRLVPPGASPVDAVSDVPAQAAISSGRRAWVLQNNRLTMLDDLSVRPKPPVTVPIDVSDANSQPVLLLSDTPSGQMWVVMAGGNTGQVIQLDAFSLQRERNIRTNAITGAAVLNGNVYVISGRSLVEFVNGRPHVRATLAYNEFNGIAADPVHHRLLLVDLAFPTQMWSYRPGADLTAVATLPFTKASLAVVAGQTWVGGYGGPRLVHVAGGHTYPGPFGRQIGPGGVVVGRGQHVFWVRDGNGDDNALWCVDGATGRAVQHWNVSGQVASANGTAVVANSAGLLQLHLAGCRG